MEEAQSSAAEEDRQEEMQRRADVVRRYCLLTRPSLDDDERFALELGLGRDSLYRLAAAWRRHGRSELLQGARPRVRSDAVAAAIKAAEGDLDMSGVSPARRSETERRIAVIHDYLRIPQPTKDDGLRAARAFGVQHSRFRRIVKSWLLHRSPAAIPGAVIAQRRADRSAPRVSKETEQSIMQAIGRLGVAATSSAIHSLASELCAQNGWMLPTRTTTYHRLQQARGELALEDEAVVIDHVAVSLAVVGTDGPQLPVLSLAFHIPTRHIIAHRLSLTGPTADSTMDLVDELLVLQDLSAPSVPLRLRAPPGMDWTRLLDRLGGVVEKLEPGRGRALAAGRLAASALGDRLGGLRFRPRATASPSLISNPLPHLQDPLDFARAEAVVADIVRAHNANARAHRYRLAAVDGRPATAPIS